MIQEFSKLMGVAVTPVLNMAETNHNKITPPRPGEAAKIYKCVLSHDINIYWFEFVV